MSINAITSTSLAGYQPMAADRLASAATSGDASPLVDIPLQTVKLDRIIPGMEQRAEELMRDAGLSAAELGRGQTATIMMRIDKAWSDTLKTILVQRPWLAKADFDFTLEKKTVGENGNLRILVGDLSEAERNWLERTINANKELVESVNDYADAVLSVYGKYRELGQTLEGERARAKAEENYDRAHAGIERIPFRELLDRLHQRQIQEFGYSALSVRGQQFGAQSNNVLQPVSPFLYQHAGEIANRYFDTAPLLGFAEVYYYSPVGYPRILTEAG